MLIMRGIAIWAALILILLTITGCWNRRELNDVYVVLAIGIDKVEDEFEVTVQVADPSQMSPTRTADRTATTVFSTRESTVIEALRKMTTSSSRRMYGGHLLIVMLDEETARSGIQEPLELLFRDGEVRPDFLIAVVRNYKAKDVLQLISPTEILPAMDLYKSLRVSEKAWAPTSGVRVRSLLQQLTKDGIEPVLTGLTLEGDIQKGKTFANIKQQKPAAKYVYTGMGVFKNDQLKGWLNTSDSKAYTYIMNHITSTVGSVKCPRSDQDFAVEVTHAKVIRHPSIINDKPHMKLEVHIEANVAEMYCHDIDLNNQKDADELQQAAKNITEQILNHGIQTAQNKYGADIFGFGENFHRKYPRAWAQWKHHWDDMFKSLTYELEIDYRINKYGNFGSPFGSGKE